MPWTPSEFSSRHNRKLKGKAASTAAKIATGLVKKGMSEGQAIRIANAAGDKIMSRADRRYGRTDDH